MKVALVRARAAAVDNTRAPASLSKEIGPVMPLGIAYIAAYLREHGVEVSLIDADAEGVDIGELERRLAALSPNVVGITSMTPTFPGDLDAARAAKRCGATVVMGGPHVSAMPEETLAYREIDYAIRGEGEIPMLALIRMIEARGDPSAVPGLAYRDAEGRVRMNEPYIHGDLDALPFPARDLLPFDRYQSIITRGRLSTLCVGRGCPFRCAFCFKQPSDRSVRYRDPVRIADEVEEVVARFEPREINIVTDTLTARQDVVARFCEELIRRRIRISWTAPTRADCVNLDLLKLMKRAGCRSLRFGVESGSRKILNLMNKGCDEATLVRAFDWARQARLETFAYFIIGYLHETEETVRETLALARKLKPDLAMYNVATPLPGTVLFDQSVEAGLVPKDYWRQYVLGQTTERIPYLFKDADRWIGIAYREFYFSPRFIYRYLRKLRPSDMKAAFGALRGLLSLE